MAKHTDEGWIRIKAGHYEHINGNYKIMKDKNKGWSIYQYSPYYHKWDAIISGAPGYNYCVGYARVIMRK